VEKTQAKLTVHLPAELRRRLESFARARDRSLTAEARRAISKHVAEHVAEPVFFHSGSAVNSEKFFHSGEAADSEKGASQ
jgi:hypothetical protein